jgi:hypothetical protein
MHAVHVYGVVLTSPSFEEWRQRCLAYHREESECACERELGTSFVPHATVPPKHATSEDVHIVKAAWGILVVTEELHVQLAEPGANLRFCSADLQGVQRPLTWFLSRLPVLGLTVDSRAVGHSETAHHCSMELGARLGFSDR